MKEAFDTISSIWWFFYRVFYTLMPATAFTLALSVYAGNGYLGPTIAHIIKNLQDHSNSMQIALAIIIIVILNIIVESFVVRTVYYSMGFVDLSTELLRIKGTQRNILNIPVFNRMEVRSLMFHPKVFMHAEYLLAREFLFNNLWIFLILYSIILLPLPFFQNFENMRLLIGLIVCLQLIFFYYLINLITSLLKKIHVKQHQLQRAEYEYDILEGDITMEILNSVETNWKKQKKEEKDLLEQKEKLAELTERNEVNTTMRRLFKLFIFLPIVLIFIIPEIQNINFSNFIENVISEAFLINILKVIGYDLIIGLISYYLIYTAFREFYNVEKTIHGYREESKESGKSD